MKHHHQVEGFGCPAVGDNPIADSTLKPYVQLSAKKRKDSVKKPNRPNHFNGISQTEITNRLKIRISVGIKGN